MTNEKGKSNITGRPALSGGQLKISTPHQLMWLYRNSEALQSSEQASNPNGASVAHVEDDATSFSVFGSLPMSPDAFLDAVTFTYEPARSEIPSQVDPHIAAKQEHIKALLRECYGHQFKEVYAYQVNGAFCFVKKPEAVAEQFGIPQEQLAGLKEAGDEYTGKDIAIKRIGLDEMEQVLEQDLASQKLLIKEMAGEFLGTELKVVYAYQVNGELRLAESPEAMANYLGLPKEKLAEIKIGDKHKYNGAATEDVENEIERIPVNRAVKKLQAKRDTTAHGDSKPTIKHVHNEIEKKAKDAESLDMASEGLGVRLGDNQISQQELDIQFELFLKNEEGKQIRKILEEIYNLKSKISWKEKSRQKYKYDEYMHWFNTYKRKFIYGYSKNDELNVKYEIKDKNDERIVKDMNNILLAARLFLIEQHYISFLETPQGQSLAQLEGHHSNIRQLFEQHCSVEVCREVNHFIIAKYHFLLEELVKAYIDPHGSDEKVEKCLDNMKDHIEEANKRMSEKIKSLSKNSESYG